VSATLDVMAKKDTVQVRIPSVLSTDIAIVAPALGKTITEYVEEHLAAAVAKDWPRVQRIIEERAKGKPAKGDK